MQRSDVAVQPRGSSGAGRRRSTAAASEACPDWGIGPSGACDQVEKKAHIQAIQSVQPMAPPLGVGPAAETDLQHLGRADPFKRAAGAPTGAAEAWRGRNGAGGGGWGRMRCGRRRMGMRRGRRQMGPDGRVCGAVGWRSYASGGGMGRPRRGGRRRMGADAARSEADGGGSGAARLTLGGASAQRGRAEGRMEACGLARLKRKPFGWSWAAKR